MTVTGNAPSFQGIIDEVSSVRSVAAGANQQDVEMVPREPEEEKRPELPDPLTDLFSLITKQDNIALAMNQHEKLNHLPKKIHEHVKQKKSLYRNSVEEYVGQLYKSLTKLISNDSAKDKLHEGFDPAIALEDVFMEHG